jgi:hypothetical protein
MASRKLAQQRVLRIMQAQASQHADPFRFEQPAGDGATHRLAAGKGGGDMEKPKTRV